MKPARLPRAAPAPTFEELVLEVLREIRDELRAQREAREVRQPLPGLRAKDSEALVRLLPVIAARSGGGSWKSAEVMEASAERSPAGADLRLALGGRNTLSLGKLLERAVGHVVNGLRVERAGDATDGALWRCVGDPSAIETPGPSGR